MKRTLSLLAVLVMVVSLAGCVGGGSTVTPDVAAETTAAPAEKPYAGQSIAVQVWGGTYEETMRNYAIPMFEEQTGASVEVVTGDCPIAQLAIEGDAATVDVVHLDPNELIEGNKQGVFEALDAGKLTNYADLYTEAKGFDEAIVTNWGTYGLCYRTDLIDKPTSWEDMFSDIYAGGKLAFYDYTMGGGYEMIDLISRMEGDGGITDTEHWDNLFNKLSTLRGNIGLFITSNEEVNTALSNGDVYAATYTNGKALRLAKDVDNIGFVLLPEGIPSMTSLATVTKGSAKKDLAYIFLDILCSPEVQQAYAENNYYAPSNGKTKLSDELKANMPYGQEEISKLIYMDLDNFADVKEALITRIESDFKGQ